MSSALVAIIGGGVSGLATAYFLSRLGIRSVLIEKSQRLGGLIQTELVDGCRLEAGPDSYISSKPAVTELARELGELGGQTISSNHAERRIYIVREGKLASFPQGMTMMVPGKWGPALRSDLFSWKTKLRFLAETFAAPRERDKDFSVGELVTDHFGREVLEYVAEPLLAGVYGGDAAHLSAPSVLPKFTGFERRYGSLITGVRREKAAAPRAGLFLSFQHGMQSLTDALAHNVEGWAEVIHAEVTAVSQDRAGWKIHFGDQSLTAGALVLACPAHAGAALLDHTAPDLAAELAAIPYSSAILVTLLYDSASFRHSLNGFGFLVPKNERQTVAAATWINRKFPGRVADGLVAMRGFIVGEDAEDLSGAADAELTRLAEQDFDRFMGLQTGAQRSLVHRWPQSMPQYVVGHQARQRRIAELAANLTSLYLVGNAYDGVGIPDCVRLAQTAANAIREN